MWKQHKLESLQERRSLVVVGGDGGGGGFHDGADGVMMNEGVVKAPAVASCRKTVAMLRGGGLMLLSPSVLHTKLVMAVASLSGLTACIAQATCHDVNANGAIAVTADQATQPALFKLPVTLRRKNKLVTVCTPHCLKDNSSQLCMHL